MINVTTKSEIEQMIAENPMLVLYFTGASCGACEVIKYKVEHILERYPAIKGVEVQGERYPELAAQYQVFALPLLIGYVEGKETLREGRHMDLLALESKLDRYYELMGL